MDNISKHTYWLTAYRPVWKFGFDMLARAFKGIVEFLWNIDGFKNTAM